LPRTDQLAHRYAPTWWLTGAEAWARDYALPSTILGRAFIAAIVAHGDIPFTDLADYPIFGLAVVGGPGRQYAERWRDVLANRHVSRPTQKPGPRAAAPSPVRVHAAPIS
jgi:hypothetical protein